VHEFVLRVKAHAAPAGGLGRIAQVMQRDARDADVQRLAFHVQAPFGDPAPAFLAQFRVCSRAAVAGNDLERGIAAKGLFEPVQVVKKLRVHAADLVGIMVAQEMVEFFERLGNILVPHCINDAQLFACVRVLEGQAARSGLGWQGGQGRRGGGKHYAGGGQIGHAAQEMTA